MIRRLITSALLLCLCIAAEAKLAVSNICSDGMVLQQNSEALLWGTSDPGAQVTVTPSWNGRQYRCRTDADGRWTVKVQTPEGSYKSYSITVKGGGETVRVNDVLIGEVWFASGQSNMEMPMRGFFNCPVENAQEYICAPAATEKIRMFTVPIRETYELQTEVDAQWKGAEPETVPGMSATAFFFARKLNEMLDIPVGIVSCARGGARVESWLPREILENYPDEDLSKEAIEAMAEYLRPFKAYNGMMHPLKGYTIKGFIWYQGCSNIGGHEKFVSRMNDLISHWRESWGDTEAELPFYMVEIAPYRYKPAQTVSYASLLRLAQHEVAQQVPNCGIVVTNDLVDSFEMDNIHPMRKLEVGERLARLALNRDYGFSTVACYSPEAVRCYRLPAGNELAVELTHTSNGMSRWMEIEGLEVAGSEGIFYPVSYAYFEWGSNILRIRSEYVFDPCEVRYGWGDFKPGNLKNTEGMPVSPFWLKMEK